MSWKTRFGDRRSGLRYEIVGTLAGSMTVVETLPVRNIGPGGALVEAPWPLPHGSVHLIRLQADSEVTTCEARVRHVRQASDRPGTYLVGLEFVEPDPHALDDFQGVIAPYPSTR
jgi:hypothetical protein